MLAEFMVKDEEPRRFMGKGVRKSGRSASKGKLGATRKLQLSLTPSMNLAA